MKTLLTGFIIIFMTASFSNPLSAQNEKNLWYFGQNAFIDFNGGTPTVGSGPLNTLEGCATIADSNGSLLFFTDGINVYDNTGSIMPNGTGLKGDPSSTHSALVVPNPCDDTIYYIFTTASIGQDGMYYYTVDLSLGTNGEVVSGSETLLLIDATEKVAAVKHSNGEDFWVTTTRETTGFVEIYSWEINASGVAVSPNIYTSTHPTLTNPTGTNGATGNYPGQIKFNSNGTLLAAAQLYYDREIDFFDFDPTTGFATSFITAHRFTDGDAIYGLEFSPNDNYLYATGYFLNRVQQLDITSLPAIPSPITLGTLTGIRGGALQLSPNGLSIYCAEMNTAGIAQISNINTASPTLVNNAITLATATQSGLGLPTFVSGIQNLTPNCLDLDPVQLAIPSITTQAIADEISQGSFTNMDKEYGDFDNDGDTDILYTKTSVTSNSPELHVLINTAGSGNPPIYTIPGINLNVDFCYSHRLYDWDNDGWNDVVVYGHNAGVYVFFNNQTGGLNPTPTALLQGTVDFTYVDQALIEVGDLSNDGLPDLLISSQNIQFPGTVYFENLGGNNFSLPTPQIWTPGVGITNPFIPENSGSYPTPELYDADCDGDIDLFISDPLFGPPFGGGRMFYHENNGGVSASSLPNVNISGVTNQFGFLDDVSPSSDLACDWLITRIVDYKSDRCPVAISYNPCNDEFFFYDQDCECDGTLAINDIETAVDLSKIYLAPNPTIETFRITSEIELLSSQIAIYDINGRKVLQENYSKNTPIDVRSLSAGLYLVKLKISEGNTITKKLIKQ